MNARGLSRLRGDLQRAKVHRGTAEAQIADTRTNSEAAVMIKSSDIPVCFVRDRIAGALRVAPEFCEVAKLLHYEPGQTFKLHSDFLETTTPAMREVVLRYGQRVATFLLYLSDEYAGGETEFPNAGFQFKGRKGDGLFLAPAPKGADWLISI